MASTAANTSGESVEVELGITDRDCFLVRVSDEASCRIHLEDVVHRADGKLLEFFTIQEAPADRILAMGEDEPAISEVRLVRAEDAGDLFEFVVSGPCVIATLAEAGVVTRSVRAERGQGRIVADVPPHVEVREVVESFRVQYPDSRLLARRTGDDPIQLRSEQGARARFADRLTDKQLEVLETAYRIGYFDWPRRSSADECADALGISQPTFSQHIRAAQHRMFEALFETDTR